MKIVQLHNAYLEAGGEDAVVRRERHLLQERGHEVEVLEFANPQLRREQVKNLAIANWNPASFRVVTDNIQANPPDVVHVHNTWFTATSSAVVSASRFAPVVATLHNYRLSCLNAYHYRDGAPCIDCVGRLPWRGIGRKCYRDSLPASIGAAVANVGGRVAHSLERSVDRFLVLSDFARGLAAKSGLTPGKILRHDNFALDPGARSHRADGSDRVLAVGRLSPEKGFRELVQHWNQRASDDLKLTILGDGPEREALSAIAGQNVELVGRCDPSEVSRMMLNSRALVFPSRWFEGQPLVLLEALAAGLPIVASNHPPIREVLDDGVQVLVDSGDWRACLENLDDGRWVSDASEAARRRYDERYRPEIAAERLEAIYRSVID